MLRSLTTLPGIDWLQPLQETCASFGVSVVIVKELAGCRINGATRWLAPDKAMIALSLRHRRNDIFWFTFFHELCHVLRHSKKLTFVDSNWSDINADLETEADNFASRTLIPDYAAAADLSELSSPRAVERFARSIGIAPGIVVGRMQHDGLIPHRQWTQFIVRYQLSNE